MRCTIFLSLLPLAICMCMDGQACMDAPGIEALEGSVAGQALLQVRKKEAQLTFQEQHAQGEELSFLAKLVLKRHNGETDGIGSEVPLDEAGYEQVKETCCLLEMMFFVRRVIDEVLHFEICNEGGLQGFVPWFTCETNSQKKYHEMIAELKASIPPLKCAFVAPKGKCIALDFTQCHGVEDPNQYDDCEEDKPLTTKTTTRTHIPIDCTPLNKGQVCVGNGPHGHMGDITTLCECDCLQCEKLTGKRCSIMDCLDYHLVESTKCTPAWPGQAGACVADQHQNTSGYCTIPVPAGCPPVTLHTTTTTTTVTLDCSPLNVGEVCVGSGPGAGAKTTLCTCDCELCESKLKMMGEHRPCVSSDCLNLHLTDVHDCSPTWPGGTGVCAADLDLNTSSLCVVPLPPGCLVPTPPPGTTTTTSPATCDALNGGEVCVKAGVTSTTTCQCDCVACSAKKGSYCTADDCITLGFFDVSTCTPTWPGSDGACEFNAKDLCKIPVPAGCPPIVVPPPPGTTTIAATTTKVTTTKAPLTTPMATPPPTTTTLKVTTTEAPATTTTTTATTAPSTTTTSMDCSPINGDKGSVCSGYSGEGKTAACACDCVKCRHFLGYSARWSTPETFNCDAATCVDYSEDVGFNSTACLAAGAPGVCIIDPEVSPSIQSTYCKIDVPEGCPQPHTNVSCGGHSAISCPECGAEPGLCNGDCEWIMGYEGCRPSGNFVNKSYFDCGDGQRTDDCSLCDEDVCRRQPRREDMCQMAWSVSGDDPSDFVEGCVRPPIAYPCDGLDDRYSKSDCDGCAGPGLYGYWREHDTLGYFWENEDDPSTGICYEKATNPNPCTPFPGKGNVCYDFGTGTGNCTCDCEFCRKLRGEACGFNECMAYAADTGTDAAGCQASAAPGTCETGDTEGGRSSWCTIPVPAGCPQPQYEPVDCGNGVTAATCLACASGSDSLHSLQQKCGGECVPHLGGGDALRCYPRGEITNELYDCGNGTLASYCELCPIEICRLGSGSHPNPSKNCVVTQDDTTGEDECSKP